MAQLGLDIGYSNTKFAYCLGAGVKPTVGVLPSGSAPETHVMEDVSGAFASPVALNVNGMIYNAGIDPNVISAKRRTLDANYPLTDDYLALYYRVLHEMGASSVSRVVTGLPVSQSNDDEFKRALTQRLEGKHKITKDRTVTVKEVILLPQPMGAFFNYVATNPKDKVFLQSNVVILDPGFFTADWCVFRAGKFDKRSSDSSQEAVSAVLEEAAASIRAKHGRTVLLEDLENAVRNKTPLYIFGTEVAPGPFVEEAAGLVADSVMRNLQQTLRRSLGDSPDIVLLTGGGATLYEAACKVSMPKSRIITMPDPVSANACGFNFYSRLNNKPGKKG